MRARHLHREDGSGPYASLVNLPEEFVNGTVAFILAHSQVKANSTEEAFAKDALFKRHPEMSSWPDDHGWFFAKMNMSSILVLDYFGGVKTVTLKDYFNADIRPAGN